MMTREFRWMLLLLLGAGLLFPGASAMLNPAATYCTGLNYTYTVTTTPDG